MMNFRRGFFRLWLIVSVLFVAVVGLVSYESVMSEFKRAADNKEWAEVGLMLIPIHCKDARGTSGTDYTGRDGPWSDYSAQGQCMYKMADFRRLYPEYSDLSDNVLVHKTYEKAARPLLPEPEPWWTLGRAVGIAAAIPFVVLLLGWAIAWALSGFVSKAKATGSPSNSG
jgi:hypothetical protein